MFNCVYIRNSAFSLLTLLIGCGPQKAGPGLTAEIQDELNSSISQPKDLFIPIHRWKYAGIKGPTGDINVISINSQVPGLYRLLTQKMGFIGTFTEERSVGSEVFDPPSFVLDAQDGTTLPGIIIKQATNGSYSIIPDYRQNVVIHAILDPAEGFKRFFTINAKSSSSNEDERSFIKKVEEVKNDGNYKAAWIVEFSVERSSSIPSDSPFWELLETFKQLNYPINSELKEPFWTSKGAANQSDQKPPDDRKFYVLAFEPMKGLGIKFEPCKPYLNNQ